MSKPDVNYNMKGKRIAKGTCHSCYCPEVCEVGENITCEDSYNICYVFI